MDCNFYLQLLAPHDPKGTAWWASGTSACLGVRHRSWTRNRRPSGHWWSPLRPLWRQKHRVSPSSVLRPRYQREEGVLPSPPQPPASAQLPTPELPQVAADAAAEPSPLPLKHGAASHASQARRWGEGARSRDHWLVGRLKPAPWLVLRVMGGESLRRNGEGSRRCQPVRTSSWYCEEDTQLPRTRWRTQVSRACEI